MVESPRARRHGRPGRRRNARGALLKSRHERDSTLRAERGLLRRRIADVERDGHLNFRYSEPLGLEYAHFNSLPANLYRDLYPWEWPWEPPLAWNSLTPAQMSRALGDGLPPREVPGFETRLVGNWEPYGVRDADEDVGSPTIERWLQTMINQGVVRARIETTPMAAVKSVGQSAPSRIPRLRCDRRVARAASAQGRLPIAEKRLLSGDRPEGLDSAHDAERSIDPLRNLVRSRFPHQRRSDALSFPLPRAAASLGPTLDG